MTEPGGPKVAVVTGAASGIGEATAVRFAEVGWSVVGVDVDEPGLERLRAEFGVSFVAGDVAETETASRVADALRSNGWRARVLVNAAGVAFEGSVLSTSEHDWSRVIAIDLDAAYLMARAVVPLMATPAVIVNVSSIHALATGPEAAAYAAAKGGLVALTRSMAIDLAPDIRVVCVSPGAIDTPLLRNAAQEQRPHDPESLVAEWAAASLLKRLGSPLDVAAFIEFLTSQEAGFITGANFVVDGGQTARL